jgi:hypothetical protein
LDATALSLDEGGPVLKNEVRHTFNRVSRIIIGLFLIHILVLVRLLLARARVPAMQIVSMEVEDEQDEQVLGEEPITQRTDDEDDDDDPDSSRKSTRRSPVFSLFLWCLQIGIFVPVFVCFFGLVFSAPVLCIVPSLKPRS